MRLRTRRPGAARADATEAGAGVCPPDAPGTEDGTLGAADGSSGRGTSCLPPCAHCGYTPDVPVLRCPRCLTPFTLGCDGNCGACLTGGR